MKKILLLIFTAILCSCSTNNKYTIIAHRGASGYLPEHTLPAQAMAHAFDVDYIEPDVVLTKDNIPIILHDIHIDTTTDVAKKFPHKKRKDGRYYAIDLTLKQIKQLNVSERIDLKKKQQVFANRFPIGQSSFKIPTLSETIELIQGLNKSRNKNIGIYPEIKNPEFHKENKKDITSIFVKTLKKHQLFNKKAKVIIQCFYPPTLKRLKHEFNSPLPLVQLIAENSWGESSVNYDQMKTKQGLKEISSYAQGIGPWIPQLMKNQKLVKWAKENKLIIHAYTMRKDSLYPPFKTYREQSNFLINKLGIDGYFTDFSDLD